MSSRVEENSYHVEITSERRLLDFNIRELLEYRDLVFLFVKRTFISQYKQTVLGPIWAIIQPLLTTVVFTIVFGGIASLPTDGIPSFLFYLCGTICWNYFSGNITTTSTTFVSNAAIFGKVYFPRLVLPISTVITNLISLSIQMVMFIFCWIVFLQKGAPIRPNWCIVLLPLLLLQMATLSLGLGIIISALTTKYRDLAMLVGFGVQLWMYATPVAYSSTLIPEKWIGLYMLNPMTPIIELFRYGFLGAGTIRIEYYLFSWLVTILILVMGVLLFNKVEKTFMDTV
ncbi:MAG: ABC transporter permease [Candidatus Ventricola sp.]